MVDLKVFSLRDRRRKREGGMEKEYEELGLKLCFVGLYLWCREYRWRNILIKRTFFGYVRHKRNDLFYIYRSVFKKYKTNIYRTYT